MDEICRDKWNNIKPSLQTLSPQDVETISGMYTSRHQLMRLQSGKNYYRFLLLSIDSLWHASLVVYCRESSDSQYTQIEEVKIEVYWQNGTKSSEKSINHFKNSLERYCMIMSKMCFIFSQTRSNTKHMPLLQESTTRNNRSTPGSFFCSDFYGGGETINFKGASFVMSSLFPILLIGPGACLQSALQFPRAYIEECVSFLRNIFEFTLFLDGNADGHLPFSLID